MVKKILQYLSEHQRFIDAFLIPVCLFGIDLVLRAALGADPINAGTDMSLLAASSLLSLVTVDIEQREPRALYELALFLFFLIPWILCLWISSASSPVTFWLFNILDIRWLIVWIVGAVALYLSAQVVAIPID